MGTYTRAKTTRQRLHPGSRSKSHRADKAAGDQRQEATYVRVATPPRPSPKRDFSEWLQGHEFMRTGDLWTRCHDPEEFGRFLESEAGFRSYYYRDTQRKGVPVRMKTKVETPVEILTTSFPPWLSDWCAHEFSNGRSEAAKKKLAQIRNEWADRTNARLEPIRYVLGIAVHVDTSDPHIDFAVSRQSGDGDRRGAKAGLELVGPWATATDRQVRSGATIAPKKRDQLTRTVANFRHRYGATAVPLDVAMARDLDAIASAVIGPELAPFVQSYAASVPALEAAHDAAARAALDAALAKLEGPPDAPCTEPEPQPPHRGPDLNL